MRLTRIVLAVAMTGAVFAAPQATVADQPDVIGTVCVLPHSRVSMAAGRAACDEKAESLGYAHGVLRPPDPQADIENYCHEVDAVPYVCYGVGSR